MAGHELKQIVLAEWQNDGTNWKMVCSLGGFRSFDIASVLERLKPCSEVPKKWRLVSKPQTVELLPLFPESQNRFDDIVDMALGIDAAWNGQSHQVRGCVTGKHECANLDRADPGLQIQLIGQ